MAKKEQVGVINSRNKERVLMVEVDSVTYNKALRGIGGWSLANPEQNKRAAEQEKKSVTSAEGNAPEPNEPQANGEPEKAEGQAPTAPEPEKVEKPAKPKKEKPEGKIAKAVKAAKSKQGGNNE